MVAQNITTSNPTDAAVRITVVSDGSAPTEYDRFDRLARGLLAVKKSEIEEAAKSAD
jgi:hypothetical protein